MKGDDRNNCAKKVKDNQDAWLMSHLLLLLLLLATEERRRGGEEEGRRGEGKEERDQE
jgi:hypothetical protein